MTTNGNGNDSESPGPFEPQDFLEALCIGPNTEVLKRLAAVANRKFDQIMTSPKEEVFPDNVVFLYSRERPSKSK